MVLFPVGRSCLLERAVVVEHGCGVAGGVPAGRGAGGGNVAEQQITDQVEIQPARWERCGCRQQAQGVGAALASGAVHPEVVASRRQPLLDQLRRCARLRRGGLRVPFPISLPQNVQVQVGIRPRRGQDRGDYRPIGQVHRVHVLQIGLGGDRRAGGAVRGVRHRPGDHRRQGHHLSVRQRVRLLRGDLLRLSQAVAVADDVNAGHFLARIHHDRGRIGGIIPTGRALPPELGSAGQE